MRKILRYIALSAGVMLAACSSKVVQPGSPVTVAIRTDTLTVIKDVVRDSIVEYYVTVRDSSSFRKEDSLIYIERWHWERDYRYEKTLQARLDSLSDIKRDSVPYPVPYPVPVPAELTAWQKFKLNLGGGVFYAVLLVSVYLAYRIYRKLRRK